MAKEQDKKYLHIKFLEKDAEQLSERQVDEMREACPDTPQKFRDMVQRAVLLQCGGQEEMEKAGKTGQNIIRIQEYTGEKQELHEAGPRESGPRRNASSGKKRWRKNWLLAAAVLAAGSIAAAAGNSWLREQLLGRGFSEEEAGALVVTEPQQQVSELADVAYPSGTPLEKAWSEPLLAVEEAYFDGTSLYFIAKPSEEAENYDLYLRDHASVNGRDGITSLNKLEEENRYFGRIEIREKADTAEVLDADTVKVDMTVAAYPRYEGKILYTWKDADIYEQIFGIGAFDNADGSLCYVGPRKDMIAGYTPHELTVEMPLTEEGKQVIGQYLANEGLYAENSAVNLEENQTGAGEEEAGTKGGEKNPLETPEGHGDDGNKAGTAAVPAPAVIEGSHVVWEVPGEGGSLKIDAEIVNEAEHIYTGTLQAERYSDEILKSLYEEGDPEQWQPDDTGDDDGTRQSFQYQDRDIFAGGDLEITGFENNEAGAGSEAVFDETANLELCRQVLEKLGLNGRVEDDVKFSDGTAKYYKARLMLEGLPLAWSSQWNTACSMCIENGELAYAFAPAKLTVWEKEEVALPGIEKALERVGRYVQEGKIHFTDTGEAVQPVTEIALEYYVDLTKQGLVFRPIWNFKLNFLMAMEDGASREIEGYIYVDALTGALVRDTYGW